MERGSSVRSAEAQYERGSSVAECRTHNQVKSGSNPPLIPFRILTIFAFSIGVPVDSAV